MTANAAVVIIEAAVGRGVWFLPRDVPDWAAIIRDGKAIMTLLSQDRLVRREVGRDDPLRRGPWRYMLR